MLRELSSSMSRNQTTTAGSLVQPLPNGVEKRRTLPRDGGDADEVTFEVSKVEGLSGITTGSS